MSQDNVETVRRAFDAFARGDLDAVFATLDPAVKLEDHDRSLGRGSASGVMVDERQFHVFDVENRRIVRVRAFLERAKALEAAGLRDGDA
jgi:ketosteroid isomerase-like protein